MKSIFQIFVFILLHTSLNAQITPVNFFSKVVLKVDDQTFTSTRDTLSIQGNQHIRFAYDEEQSVMEIELLPNPTYPIRTLKLLPSNDFEIVDSLLNINQMRYRFKVKFKHLTQSKFLQFNFSIQSDIFVQPYIHVIKLFPTSFTNANLTPADNRLFVGEERSFTIETNRPENIDFNKQWTKGKNINYKFSQKQGDVKIHLRTSRAGKQRLQISLPLKVPNFDQNFQNLVYELPPIILDFDVKTSKLIFLHTNKTDVTLNSPNRSKGIEIELDYSPRLELDKTYRVEKQEKSGGWLVAEIYTKSVLSNGRVLCQLRTFNYHRQSEGYLYVKNGDQAKFITNFNITPKTVISRVEVLPKKGNNSKGNKIFAGEKVEIKISGEALHKTKLSIDGLEIIPSDSLLRTENELVILARIPLRINQTKVNILNFNAPTGFSLKVEEFQIAHPLDFIKISLGGTDEYIVSDIEQAIFIKKTIPDILLLFKNKKLDNGNQLFGKQYIEVEVILSDKNNRLLDRQTIPNIVICPGENSPRYKYYDTRNCGMQTINLNRLLRRKTYDLEAWDRIEIVIKHDRTKYDGQGFYRKAEIILQRDASFDLDVSFPAGLVTKKVGTEGFGNLSGVSMAIIAQFSFFQKNRIAKPRPFKFGVGFLALNAFNFSENNTSRDVGIVLLGSLYPLPTRERNKLSFPLYLGGGYFLSENKFFFLIGPGIRVRI